MGTLTFFGTPLMTSKQWINVQDGFSFENEYLYQEELYGSEGRPVDEEKLHLGTLAQKLPEVFHGPQWAYVKFEDFVIGKEGTILIGAKLDTDLNTSTCRIALQGKILVPITGEVPDSLKVFRTKSRSGVIERIDADGKMAICRDMFSKNTNMKAFMGMTVHGPGLNMGRIESSFGQNGKCKICYPKGINSKQQEGPVILRYKKYMFDKSNSKVVRQ
jgi:selenocysteine-specific elongation factor